LKKIKELYNLVEHNEFTTKANLYFSTRSIGDDFDPYEKNYKYTNLNPEVVKGYARELTPSSLVWKNYGLKEQGAVEFLCRSKYREWFEICNKIVINDKEYEVFKEASGNKVLITERPYKFIKVVLKRK